MAGWAVLYIKHYSLVRLQKGLLARGLDCGMYLHALPVEPRICLYSS